MKYENEKQIIPQSGFFGIVWFVLFLLLGILGIIFGARGLDQKGPVAFYIVSFVLGILIASTSWIVLLGIKLLVPNQALVLSLFGKYYGTIVEPGFYLVNPFCIAVGGKSDQNNKNEQVNNVLKGGNLTINTNFASSKTISLKTIAWDNGVQKVNDSLGNPLILSAVVFWRVVNPTKAVFNVDDYKQYLSSQTDSVIRNTARLYPYDFSESGDDSTLTLRSSSLEIAEEMQAELQQKVIEAGIEIVEVKLNQIAYAPEIAAAMLQRQQASAIIAARKKIVEGAVGMVQMALKDLADKDIIEFDNEKKAQMVSNLLVVLCSNKDVQPVVNSGSIY